MKVEIKKIKEGRVIKMFWKKKTKVKLLPKILGGGLCAIIVVASAVAGSALAKKLADSDTPFMQKVKENPIFAKVLPQGSGSTVAPAASEVPTAEQPESEAKEAVTSEPVAVDAVTPAPTGPIDYRQNPFVAIVKNSSPAVVNIDVETIITQKIRRINPFGGFDGDPFFEEFFGDAFPFFGGKRKNDNKRAKRSLSQKKRCAKFRVVVKGVVSLSTLMVIS